MTRPSSLARRTDQFGVDITVESDEALGHYDRAVEQLLVLRDPEPALQSALRIEPHFASAHILQGLLGILGTEVDRLPAVRAAARAGLDPASGASERERHHLAAIETWGQGRFSDACAIWERILLDEPRDALAMYAAHQGDFFLGQSAELRDRVARRLADIEPRSRLEGYYRGMLAFGLEETGQYERAEAEGLRALESDPRDAWAIHAVAHVYEMTNRTRDGTFWLLDRVGDWTPQSFFAVHNWWHLALYHLDAHRWDEALALYDAGIRGGESEGVLDMVDASALLWRLHVNDIDVGARWQRIADRWEARIEDEWYSFNDVHAAFALAGAGRTAALDRLETALTRAAIGRGDNGAMTTRVGLPVVRAVRAFSVHDWSAAVQSLVQVSRNAALGGGSNAQRDVLSLTLLAAAHKAGERSLARALANQRLVLKPLSTAARAWHERTHARRSSEAR